MSHDVPPPDQPSIPDPQRGGGQYQPPRQYRPGRAEPTPAPPPSGPPGSGLPGSGPPGSPGEYAPSSWPNPPRAQPTPTGWAQHQRPNPASGRPSWFGRHKIVTGLLAFLGALVLFGGIGSALAPSDPNRTATVTTTSTGTHSAVKAAEIATPATPATPKAEPAVLFRGRGDTVLRITKTDGPVILDAIHRGSGNFVIQDGDESQLLVNTIGDYRGSTLLDADGADTSKLKITATGRWVIKIRPTTTARTFEHATKGTGDAVISYTGTGGIAAFTHRGSGNFAVLAQGGAFPDLLVNEIGDYRGEDILDDGPTLLVITASGAWTVQVTAG